MTALYVGFGFQIVFLAVAVVGVSIQLKDLHRQLNSRLDQLLAAYSAAAHTKGVAEGRLQIHDEIKAAVP